MTGPPIGSDHIRFMRRAIALARENVASAHGGPFGAVIVKDGVIVGEGSNSVTARSDPTAHAEVMSIRAACTALGTFDLGGAVIYTSCEPCPMCLAAIYWGHLGAVYYGNSAADAAAIQFDDEFIKGQVCTAISKRAIPMTQCLRTEAQEAFAQCAASERRIQY